ncbi:MAG: hypothetical protein NVSMB17_16810 [Candidatus Dormibacteria bacterium]
MVVLLQVTGRLERRPAGVPAGLVESAFPGTDPGRGDSPRGGQGSAVDGIPCESGEQLTFHVHAHVYLLQDGISQPISENIGIPGDNPLLPRCFYWLHTHDRSGLVHIEAPRAQAFTLGQLFDIWGQPLAATAVARLTAPPGQPPVVYVDGKEFLGDPRQVELKRHTEVVIELGKKVPPPTYEFGKS